MTADRHVTEDMQPREYRAILRLLYGFLVASLLAAAVFAVHFVIAHTFTSFAATLAGLFAAWCVAGPLDELRKEGAPS
jgi:FtsH-binding integral membrane protein